MHRTICDLTTGIITEVELTEAEIAELKNIAEPEPIPEPTAAEKLAASGLTVEELKQLLGL